MIYTKGEINWWETAETRNAYKINNKNKNKKMFKIREGSKSWHFYGFQLNFLKFFVLLSFIRFSSNASWKQIVLLWKHGVTYNIFCFPNRSNTLFNAWTMVCRHVDFRARWNMYKNTNTANCSSKSNISFFILKRIVVIVLQFKHLFSQSDTCLSLIQSINKLFLIHIGCSQSYCRFEKLSY